MLLRSKGLGKSGLRKSKQRCFEQLEHRQMMAGDVTVLNSAGAILRVTGDNAGNQVVIRREASAIIIQGLEGTRINGQSMIRFSNLGNTLNGLEVNLNGGDDSLFLDDLRIRQSAVINTGAGSDTIDLDDVSVGRDLTINSGDGENAVSLDDVIVNRNLTVRTGVGNDLVGFDSLRVQGTTLVQLGAGNDRLAIEDSFHRGQVSLFGDQGNDFIGLDDTRILGAARIDAGAGNDFVYFDDTSISGNAIVQGGSGTDRIERDRDSRFTSSSRVLGFENLRATGGERTLDAVFADLERRTASVNSLLANYDDDDDDDDRWDKRLSFR